MKRLFILLASCALIAVPSAAIADDQPDEPSVVGVHFWSGQQERDRGTSIVRNPNNGRFVLAAGTRVPLTVSCVGPECEADRPVRIEIARDGRWSVLGRGTVESMFERRNAVPLRINSPATIRVRAVLPAYEGLPAMSSDPRPVQFARPTTVRPVGNALRRPGQTKSKKWEFRPGARAITLNLGPATARRQVEVFSFDEVRTSIAKGRTNAKGQVTMRVNLSRESRISIVVWPDSRRAGWIFEAYRAR